MTGSITTIDIGRLRRRPDARSINEDVAAEIADDIERFGFKSPLWVRAHGDGYEVIAGSHRLMACDLAGMSQVPCFVIDADDTAAEMMMIAENLHRSELTALERDEQVARWIALSGAAQSAQVEPIESRRAEAEQVSRQVDAKPLGGRPEGGVRAASREIGISESDARRAVKVANLSPEAKQAARETGLDNNQSAMLAAAKQPTPQAQVQAIQQHHAQRAGGVAGRYQQAAPAAPATPDPAMFDKFVRAVDFIEAMDPDTLVTAAGRRRAVLGQRASGLAERMSDIMSKLDIGGAR